MKISLKDVKPNPFRDLKRNPLDEARIKELLSSIADTGFWDNTAVRETPNGKGYELAAGHHRIEAAKRAGLTEIDVPVKNYTDADMLRVKSRDNRPQYNYNILSLLEDVQGVVDALSDGRIEPFVIGKDVRKDVIRYAPSFIPGKEPAPDSVARPYTTLAIGKFLGYTSESRDNARVSVDAVTAALNALYLIELGQLTEKLIADWTVDKLLTETRARIAAYKDTVVRREQDKEKQRQLREQFEKEKQHNKAEAERLRLENEALLEKERAARKEKAEVDAIKFAEERKENERKREQREAEFKTKRAEFDEKIEEIKIDAQKAKERDRDLPTRHAVKAMLFKLNTITSERFAFREEVKLMAQDKAVTTNERELLRQAMMRAGDWYIEQSNVFLPKPAVNVLAEARQKEEAKRKGRGANEQE